MAVLLRTSFATVVILSFAVAAFGGDGFVAVYTDEAGTNCNIVDESPGLITLYLVYKGPHQVLAASIMLEQSGGSQLTYLSATMPPQMPDGGFLGSPETGAGVAFGDFYDPPVHFMTVHYWGSGVSAKCGRVTVWNDPRSPRRPDLVEIVVSGPSVIQVPGGYAVVNPNPHCRCDAEMGGIPTPVEVTTWGGVKALYVD